MTIKMETVETDGGNTKLHPQKERSNQLLKHFFTFNNYTKSDIDDLLSKFVEICKVYVFQEEKGDSGTPHLQGCIWLKKKMRFSEFKLSNKIHWEKVIDWDKSVEYCSRESKRHGNIWSKGLPKSLKIITDLRPWQTSIINLINEDVNDRIIYWIYDASGNMGKTVFSKYLYAKQDAIIATGGGSKDIACLLAKLKEDGRDLNEKTTFIFNFPRCTEGISYKAIESVKDGLITSPKYESCTLVFNCPHVFVFSNEKPNITKLSLDRWRIFTINDNKLEAVNIETIGDDEGE